MTLCTSHHKEEKCTICLASSGSGGSMFLTWEYCSATYAGWCEDWQLWVEVKAGSALQQSTLQCKQPFYLALWPEYPMVLKVVMVGKAAMWDLWQISWDNHSADSWSFGERPCHLQRIICLWKTTPSVLLGPGRNRASWSWDTRRVCGHSCSSWAGFCLTHQILRANGPNRKLL